MPYSFRKTDEDAGVCMSMFVCLCGCQPTFTWPWPCQFHVYIQCTFLKSPLYVIRNITCIAKRHLIRIKHGDSGSFCVLWRSLGVYFYIIYIFIFIFVFYFYYFSDFDFGLSQRNDNNHEKMKWCNDQVIKVISPQNWTSIPAWDMSIYGTFNALAIKDNLQ